MNPEDLPSDDQAVQPTPRPDAAPTPPAVDGAFLALVQQLRAAALAPGADFDRCTSYLRAVEALAGRWKALEPAHGLRGKKGGAS